MQYEHIFYNFYHVRPPLSLSLPWYGGLRLIAAILLACHMVTPSNKSKTYDGGGHLGYLLQNLPYS